MTKQDWQINIENLFEKAEKKHGTDVASWPFKRLGAREFSDLSPANYEEVFSDLMLMDSED